MEFKSGYSYFCKKDYGNDPNNEINQFLGYIQPRNRHSGNLNYYNNDSYYCPIWLPKFTAGNIYRCNLCGAITDDVGNFVNISSTSIDPDSFVEINIDINNSAKNIIANLNRYGITVEIIPYEVVGGEINNGVIIDPDTTITKFKVYVARIGSIVTLPGHFSAPPIHEMGIYEVKGNLSEEIGKAVYDMWKKIRIQSAWCSAIRRTLNHRLSIEKKNKIRELKK